MKKTIITACSLMALAALATACGPNNRKSLASMPSTKGQKWDSYSPHTYKKETTHCFLTRPVQQAYGKVLGYKASSLTIKDHLK